MNANQHFDEYIKNQFHNYKPDVPADIWENIISKKVKVEPVNFWSKWYKNKTRLLLLSLMVTIGGGIWIYKAGLSSKSKVPTYGEQTEKSNYTDPKKLPESENIKPYSIDMDVADSIDNISPSGTKSSVFNPPGSAKKVTGYNKEKHANNINKEAETNNILVNSSTEIKKDYLKKNTLLKGAALNRLAFIADKIAARKIDKQNLLASLKSIKFFPDCPAIEKDAAGNKKYIEIYAGPDYSFQKLIDTGNASVYAQRIKESTDFLFAYSAGIRYTRVFNNSMSLRVGINYSQINERFSFVQGNIVNVTYIISSNGDTTGSFTTTGTRIKTTYNKYRSIDIPAVVGYEVGNGKWHANFNAGIAINLYNWQKGDMLNETLQPISISTGKDFSLKINAGVSFMAGISAYYKLNEKMHLMAEPYLRYNYTPIINDNTTLRQKYHITGIRLGLRMDLK